MKKIILCLVFALLTLQLQGQSLTITNFKAGVNLMPSTTDEQVEVAFSFNITTPMEYTSVVVMLGLQKDLFNVGLTEGHFYKQNEQWILLPNNFIYSNGIVQGTLKVLKTQLPYLNYYTVYARNTKGEVISNKVYFSAKGN